MGFKEIFERWSEKRKEDKKEFRSMERDQKFKKILENKQKTPMQKEHEFYNREQAREHLKKTVESQRKERKKKMDKLSSPFNNPPVIDNNDFIKSEMKWT